MLRKLINAYLHIKVKTFNTPLTLSVVRMGVKVIIGALQKQIF